MQFDGKTLLTQPTVNISQQRIFAGFAADAQVCAVGLGKGWALQTFAHASLIVIKRKIRSHGGHVIHQQLECLAAAAVTTLEF